ncbi:MAG TPA: SNF2-related protein, partial [Chthoniobacterales bacterium]
MSVAITQKLLVSAGGWPVMKQAQQLHAAARVSEAKYEPPVLSGIVREGNRSLRSGLRIKSERDVENLCTCRESREWGKICPHALAVGLAFLEPPKTAPTAAPEPNEKTPAPVFVEIGCENATPLTLHFILPPNFESSWTKDQIMIVTEVDLDGKRVMPNALRPNERYACDTHDLDAIDAFREFFDDAELIAAMRIYPRRQFLRVLRGLRGHLRVTFGKTTKAEIAPEFVRPPLLVRREGESLKLSRIPELLAAEGEAWVRRENSFRRLPDGLPNELFDLADRPVTLRGDGLILLAPRVHEWFTVEGDGLPEVQTAMPQFILKLEGSLREIRADLRARYGDVSFSVDMPEPRIVRSDHAILLRNSEAEANAIARLGFVRRGDKFVLSGENNVARFFAFEYPRLTSSWEVTLSPQVIKASSELEPLAPKIEIVGSGENWFELSYSLATPDGTSFSAAELQRLLRSGQSTTRLRNGRTAVFDTGAISDFEEVLRDSNPRQKQPGVYRIDRAHAGYIAATAEDIGVQLRRLTSHATAPLPQLDERLRDYQREGVAWLWRLAHSNLGGILADEMGLGKTVQTLAFLRALRADQPALIVCPTSLVTNWRNEAQRFAPDLRVLTLEGPDRHARFPQIATSNIALTSYALLQRDAEKYRDLQFSTVVLDEAQHIKNPHTQNAQAAFALRAHHRFVLTGTPIENSVRDLWSIMNFALPGYLGSRADFRERYEQPLARGEAPDVQRRLARRMRPFLLRRKKTDVAKELPDKIEQQVICDLTAEQRAAYDGLLS